MIGVLVGAFSAFFGGWTNAITMRFTDAFLAFPVFGAVILFVQMLSLLQERAYFAGDIGSSAESTAFYKLFELVDPVLLALILFSWMPFARLTHTMITRIKQTEFVEASRALGVGSSRIIFRHLIPNSIAPAIVLATAQVGGMVLLQASLNFIGIDAGSVWGASLAIGRRWMTGLKGNPPFIGGCFCPSRLRLCCLGLVGACLGME